MKCYRGWYTHELLELTLKEIQKYAKLYGINLVDPENPTPKELIKVYKNKFAEMADPWEVTANGICKVQAFESDERWTGKDKSDIS